MRSLPVLVLGASTLALAACATADGAAAPTFEIRVLVKLVRASNDAGAIADAASATAKAPARYVAATSERWHALALGCTSPADCLAVVDRLRAAATVFEAVQIDATKRPAAS